MGFKLYLMGCWVELWNPDSRAWQFTDRILFVILPVFSFVLFIIPKTESQTWRDDMLNLAWIIPLSVWILFLLVIVPYRLVRRYHYKHEDTAEKLTDAYIVGEKLKTAIFTEHDDGEMATVLYKDWGELVAKVFMDDPVELGTKRLIGLSVENTDLKTPIPEDWDTADPATGIYIMLDVQLRKLNSLIQGLLDRG